MLIGLLKLYTRQRVSIALLTRFDHLALLVTTKE